MHTLHYQEMSKNSFLRALREVAPKMELFLENHGQYIYIKIVIKLIYIQKLNSGRRHDRIFRDMVDYFC